MRTLTRPALIALLALAAAGLWPSGTSVEATGVVAIDAEDDSTCVVTAGGAVECWGGFMGQAPPPTALPFIVPGLGTGVVAVARGYASSNHTCALTSLGTVQCWGDNTYGQLGDGTTNPRAAPANVLGLPGSAIAIAAGGPFACALIVGGSVWCWGAQFADVQADSCGGPSESCSLVPIQVPGLSGDITEIFAGSTHLCAESATSGLWCWGRNSSGQLGDGQACGMDCGTPVQVSGFELGAASVALGDFHSCALTLAGVLKCWGYNFDGQIGDGTTINRTTPVDVVGLADVAIIGAGSTHTCAAPSSAGLKCWGSNHNGQLGIGTLYGPDQLQPVDVLNFDDTVAGLALGDYHTCAVTDSNEVKCWSENNIGQVGNNTFSPALTPRLAHLDSDGDGCRDASEVDQNPAAGGQRNPKDVWDFFNSTAQEGYGRNVISIEDIVAIVSRFGSSGDMGIHPLSPPPAPPAYHTAFDRTFAGPPSWKTGPPNGSITIQDITLSVAQFGHTCA